MSKSCYLFTKTPPCFIQLGRFGDLIILLPAFKAIYERTGLKPIVAIGTDYASLADGVSYVNWWPMPLQWWQGIPAARREAERYFHDVVVPQWWNDSGGDHEGLGQKLGTGGVVLQCHGHEWGVDIAKWPNYMASMWDRAGFTREEMLKLPLVFDKRDPVREEALARSTLHGKKPFLLYNFKGISSPFAFTPEITSLMRKFSATFTLVDLGAIHATRIYDLLGLYDRAFALVTSDTSTLHLAMGAKLPYIAFTVDGWSGSTPRGNCQLQLGYNSIMTNLSKVEATLSQWAQEGIK